MKTLKYILFAALFVVGLAACENKGDELKQ